MIRLIDAELKETGLISEYTKAVPIGDVSVTIGSYKITLCLLTHDEPRVWDIHPHSHANYEIHMIVSGNEIMTVANGHVKVGAGTTIITGPGVVHSQVSDNGSRAEEYGLRFTIEKIPAAHAKNADDMLIDKLVTDPFAVFEDGGKLSDICEELIDEACADRPGRLTRIKALFSDYMILLGREIIDLPESAGRLRQTGRMDTKTLLDCFFSANRSTASTEELTKLLHISERHLRRLMQELYGMNLTEKMNEIRVERAKELLLSTDLTYEQIADELSFGTQQYFSRVFKKKTGMTPSAFRSSARLTAR